MKRTSKVIISLLVLVAMLGNLLPQISLLANVSAADGAGYHYQQTSSVTPGKEYIIVNTNAPGTAYALSPADGAASGNVTSTTSVAVTINADGTITGDENLTSLEWEFMISAADTNDTGTLHMLQNKSTGAWLWNPAYETDTETLGTAVTPLQDEYNGGTFAVFDFASSGGNVGLEATENLLTNVNGTIQFVGSFLRHQSPAGGDGNLTVNFHRYNLSADEFKFMQYTYHIGNADDPNNAWQQNQPIAVFPGTSEHPGPDGATRVVIGNINSGWNSRTYDLYSNVPGAGWRGTVDILRIDPQDGGDANRHGYIDSVSLGKTARGVQVLANYRLEMANKRAGGQYPSVEYPFMQFKFASGVNGSIAFCFYGGAEGTYYLVPASSEGESYRYSTATVGGAYLYEKVYEGDDNVTWVLADSLSAGDEFVLASAADGRALTNNGFASITVSGNQITSNVPENATWGAYTAGKDVSGDEVFWLNNNATHKFLRFSGPNVDMNYDNAAFAGNLYRTDGTDKNVYKYKAGHLYASFVDKSCVIADTGFAISISGSTLNAGVGQGELQIYKKTYHEHSFVAIETQNATCTDDGYIVWRCTSEDCGHYEYREELKATGHTLGSNATNLNDTNHYYTCTKCSAQITEQHDLSWSFTNTDHTFKCSKCDYAVTNPHTISESVTGGDCAHPSLKVRYCSDGCGWTETEEGATTDHTPDLGHEIVQATCTEGGLLRYRCLVCDAKVGDDIVTDPHGHMFGDCYKNAEGKYEAKCMFCGYIITEDDADYDDYYDAGLIGDPVSNSDYIYVLADEFVDGHKYLIGGRGRTGSGWALASIDREVANNVYSVPVTVNAGNSLTNNRNYIDGPSVADYVEWVDHKTGGTHPDLSSNPEYGYLQNSGNGYYLYANSVDQLNPDISVPEWEHLNVGSAKDPKDTTGGFKHDDFYFRSFPATSVSGGTTTSTGVGTVMLTQTMDETESHNFRMGFQESLYTNGYTIPGAGALRFTDALGYYNIAGYYTETSPSVYVDLLNDPNQEGVTGNLTLDLDFSLGSPESCLILYRPDPNNHLYGDRIEILGGPIDGYFTTVNIVANELIGTNPEDANHINFHKYLASVSLGEEKFNGTAVEGGLTNGYNVFHHLRVISTDDASGESVSIYIDNVLVLQYNGWSFRSHVVNSRNNNSHKIINMMHWTSKGLDRTNEWANSADVVCRPDGKTIFRNTVYGGYDHYNDDVYIDNIEIRSGGVRMFSDFDGNDNIRAEGATAEDVNIQNPQIIPPDVITTNRFVAGDDSQYRVYVYEKQYGWTVEHYYDGVLDSTLNDRGYKVADENNTFSWTDKPKAGYVFDHYTAESMVVTSDSENVIRVYYTNAVSAKDDSFAVSYASTAIPSARFTANDTYAGITNAKVTGISAAFGGTLNTTYTQSQITNGTVTTANGVTVKYNATTGNVEVVSAKASDIKAEFYVEITYTVDGAAKYIYSKATVVAATSLYFEDNSGFITYTGGTLADGTPYGWVQVDEREGSEKGKDFLALYSDVYGYSETLNGISNIHYSGSTAYKLEINGETNWADNDEAKATFTFQGTGFDVLSRCDSAAGYVFLEIYKGTAAEGKPAYTYAINDYLGHEYKDGKWVETDGSAATYNVPVLKIDDLAFGTYTVNIIPSYTRSLKGTTGTTNFYLDGIRVYGSMGDDDDAKAIYENDREANAVVEKISKMLTDGNFKFTSGVNGISLDTYKEGGPNNEVYLDKGDYVTFYIYADKKPDKVTIGASNALGGSSSKLQVSYGTDSNKKLEYSINGAVDMYYDITDLLEWEADGSGYKTTAPITLTNGGIDTLALTNIKVSFGSESPETVSFNLFAGSEYDMETAVMAAIRKFAVMGDITGDGIVSVKDSRLFKSYVNEYIPLTYEQYAAADIDGNDVVNARDYQLLKALLQG